MKDFNSDPAEYGGGAKEYNGAAENKSFAGNPEPQELHSSAPEQAKRSAKPRKKGSSPLLSGFCVAAIVAVTAAVVITNSPQNVNAEIASAEATNTTVSYEINVDSEEELSAVLYNDFTRRTFPLGQGENRNVFEDLRSDTEYTLAIVGNFGFGEKTVAKQTVRTTDAPAPHIPVTEWRDRVELNCRCSIDGYFYFRMDFIDENGYFTDFEATLEDMNGKISACVFSENLYDWQRIDVANEAKLVGKEMQLTISCLSAEHGTEAERRVLFEQTVKI